MHRLLAATSLATAALIGTLPITTAAFAAASEVGDIVVTAQRREQSAQNVGIALSVLGGDDLIQRGITNVNQLQQATSNLEVEPAFGGGAAQFRIRGVGFQDYASNNSPTVGVYINEVAYPVPVMTQGLLFDMQRVEVLRGPQGTLYGRNTTGGAINFITNKPTETTTAGVTAEYGRFGSFSGEAYLSGPLGGGIGVRVAVATQQGGGFQHNRDTGESLGDADRWGGRILLSSNTDSPFSMLLDAHGGIDQSENVGLYLLSNFQTSARPGVPGRLIPADTDHRTTGWGVSPILARDAGLLPSQKPGRDNWTAGISLNMGFDFGGVKLTSITSYDKLSRREFGDWDSSASVEADTFFGSEVRVFAEEARLSSTADGPLHWVAGVYYSRQKQDERYYSDFINLLGIQARVNYDQDVESISGFGQVEYRVIPELNLIAGIRYEHETRDLNGFGSAFGGAQALPPTNQSLTSKPWTGKLGLEYKPVDQLLLYATASKGTKSGGFTTYNTGDRSGIEPFKPETLWAYEVGFKSDVNRMVQLNGAAYYYDYRDQQVLDAVCGVNGPVGKFANAKKSKIYGFEGELRLTPVDGLTITQYASYKHGEYRDYEALNLAACRSIPRRTAYTDLSGTRIPFPRTSYGGSLSYAIAAGDYVVTPGVNYSYRSTYTSWLGSKYDVPQYWLFNADLSFRPASGRWSATIWGRNIFNKEYDLTRNFFTSADIAQPGTPATYGVRLSLTY
jgi:outer membrane receptor protein involved in Fe transport